MLTRFENFDINDVADALNVSEDEVRVFAVAGR